MLLVGVAIIIIGFLLKLDTIAVVIFSGIVTGLISGMDFFSILEILGDTFIENRYMSIFIITLPVIGVLERNGLRISATRAIMKLKNTTAEHVFTLYMFIRTIASFFGIRINGHVQFIRPIIFPMAQSTFKQQHDDITAKQTESLKAIACAVENFGNFFGQNVFIANAGVLLIVGTLQELGYQVQNFEIGRVSLIIGITAIFVVAVYNALLTRLFLKQEK